MVKTKILTKTKRNMSAVNIGEKELGKEEFMMKYKKLIEKISLALSQKFYSIFKEKAYDNNQLSTDLNNFCVDVDFNNIEYTLFFMEIEKKILAKVTKLPYITHKGLLEKSKVNFLTEPINLNSNNLISKPLNLKEKENPSVKINEQSLIKKEEKIPNVDKCTHFTKVRPMSSNKSHILKGRLLINILVVLNDSEENLLQKSLKIEKLKKLKKKETDEWALIAKYNNYLLCEEKKKKLLKDKEKKEVFINTLQKQLSEKDLTKRNLKLVDKKFVEEQKKYLTKAEEEDKKAKEFKKEKIMLEKELQVMYDKQNKENKQKLKAEEKNKEKLIIDRVQEEIKVEEEMKNKKKVKGKERLFEIIDEKREKIERKSKAKEEEMKLNKKCIEEYTKILDKQEEEREKIKNTLKERFLDDKNKIEDEKARTTTEVLEKYQTTKYHQEKDEIEKKYYIQLIKE